MRKFASGPLVDEGHATKPFVFEAKYRAEVAAQLREIKERIRRGDVASFMVSENAKGEVLVLIIEPDEQ